MLTIVHGPVACGCRVSQHGRALVRRNVVVGLVRRPSRVEMIDAVVVGQRERRTRAVGPLEDTLIVGKHANAQIMIHQNSYRLANIEGINQ